MNRPRYAFFDFDGTLICQDSFLTLFKKSLKNEPWRIVLIVVISPILLLTFLLKFDKSFAKSAILWSLTVGKSKRAIVKSLRKILAKEGDLFWFQQAIPTFERLKKDGVEIVVVTASGSIWVRGMLNGKFQHFKIIIGSKLGFFAGGVILKSKNCYNQEKINRIHNSLGENFIWQSAWSDHIADLPMLKQAQERYIICPKEKHKQIFLKELGTNMNILTWTSQQKS